MVWLQQYHSEVRQLFNTKKPLGLSLTVRTLSDHPTVLTPNHDIAFAGGRLECRSVPYAHNAPSVGDNFLALKRGSRFGHHGAPHANHLSQKLICERERVRADSVLAKEKP